MKPLPGYIRDYPGLPGSRIRPPAGNHILTEHDPEIHELTMYFAMFTSVNVLRHNPTVKSEAAQHGFKDMTYGFFGVSFKPGC